jgi:hypothetical protein
MRLLKVILFAALVGSVSVIGCGDDETEATGGTGGGTGGTGGGTTEACTGGFCDTADVKADCEAAVAVCVADADLGLTEEQCEAASTELYCNLDTGTGGAGGNGGMGGGGGTSGELEGCNESLCATDQNRRDRCEAFVPVCILACEETPNACGEDECIGYALIFICNEQEI